MAHDPRAPDDRSDDKFGYAQQPLRSTDATTGDEGIEPPVGEGHDEAAIGRNEESKRQDAEQTARDLPSYTPQGRTDADTDESTEPVDAPGYTPQGRTDQEQS